MATRILLVEDDEGHRLTLSRHLGRGGYDVTAVENAERALGSVGAVQPDIILTDIRMPGMSGIELLGSLRDRNNTIPVIVMTAFGDMQGAIDAMKKGAYDYLVKPLDLDQLEAVIERCDGDRVIPRNGNAPKSSGVAFDGLIGSDPHMIAIYKTIGSIAATRTAVLIPGETGTGKELIARTIHANAPHAEEPFVAVNCTALPESLLESELFGHVRGSFTGAVNDRKGRFELAGEGTIFLDEIGDTSPAFQTKLLRVLQEREFYPIGGERPRQTHARVIAATHRHMEQLIREGRFREDLYFRLRVVEISIPPLRERRRDIPLLAEHILSRIGADVGKQLHVPDDTMGVLLSHDWPGNVRELENSLTRAAVLARGSAIAAENLGLGAAEADPPAAEVDVESLDAVERAHVQRVLARHGGNKSRAAEALRISRPRLDRIIEKYQLVV